MLWIAAVCRVCWFALLLFVRLHFWCRYGVVLVNCTPLWVCLRMYVFIRRHLCVRVCAGT